jgi:hypothetical protein
VGCDDTALFHPCARCGYSTAAFTALLEAVPKNTRNIEFLVDAEATFSGFCRTLLEEEAGQGMNRFQVSKDGTADFNAGWLGAISTCRMWIGSTNSAHCDVRSMSTRFSISSHTFWRADAPEPGECRSVDRGTM